MPVVNIGGETGVHLQHGSVRKSKKLEKIGGEEPLLLPIEGSVLQRCLLVASLLSQFKIPKIRGDYEAGLDSSICRTACKCLWKSWIVSTHTCCQIGALAMESRAGLSQLRNY